MTHITDGEEFSYVKRVAEAVRDACAANCSVRKGLKPDTYEIHLHPDLPAIIEQFKKGE